MMATIMIPSSQKSNNYTFDNNNGRKRRRRLCHHEERGKRNQQRTWIISSSFLLFLLLLLSVAATMNPVNAQDSDTDTDSDDNDDNDDPSGTTSATSTTIMTITALLPFTSSQVEESLRATTIRKNGYNDAAALWMAVEDWNNNNNNYNNQEIEGSTCRDDANVKLNITFLDSRSNRIESTRLLNEVVLPSVVASSSPSSSTSTSSHHHTHALLTHDVYSLMSTPVAIVSGIDHPHPLPFITTSTMYEFETVTSYPTTIRTMTPNAHTVAQRLMMRSHLWNATKMVALYGADEFGLSMSASQWTTTTQESTATTTANNNLQKPPPSPVSSSVVAESYIEKEDKEQQQGAGAGAKNGGNNNNKGGNTNHHHNENGDNNNNNNNNLSSADIHPMSFTDDTIVETLTRLKTKGIRTIYAVCQTYQYKPILEEAYRQGLIGKDYQWLFYGPDLNTIQELGYLRLPRDSPLAKASQGVGILAPVGDGISLEPYLPNVPRAPPLLFLLQNDNEEGGSPYETFRRRWRDAIETEGFRETLLEHLPHHTSSSGIMEGGGGEGLEFYPEPSTYAPFLYDAVWSLGLALCGASSSSGDNNNTTSTTNSDNSTTTAAPPPPPSGLEIIQHFKKLKYRGTSGRVEISSKSSARRDQNYVVWNIRERPQNSAVPDDDMIEFGMHPSLHYNTNNNNTGWTTLQPFYFTAVPNLTAPNSIAPVEYDYHYIGSTGRTLAYCIMSITMVASIASWIWMLCHREERAVRAAQPIFLTMISLGSFLTSASILPLGLDDTLDWITQRGLDISCNATIWLYVIGMGCSYSALTAKARGVYQAYNNPELDCVLVTAHDFCKWYLIILILNVSLLTAWALTAPLEYVRIPVEDGTLDIWGRNTESYGACSNKDSVPYAITILTMNLSGVILGCWWSWQTRNIETEYRESRYVGLSLAFTLQAWCIGLPITIMVWDTSDARFFVAAGVVFVTAVVDLTTIYGPKILAIQSDRNIRIDHEKRISEQLHVQERRRRKTQRTMLHQYPSSKGLSDDDDEVLLDDDDDDNDIADNNKNNYCTVTSLARKTSSEVVWTEQTTNNHHQGATRRSSGISSIENSIYDGIRTPADSSEDEKQEEEPTTRIRLNNHNNDNDDEDDDDDDGSLLLAPPQMMQSSNSVFSSIRETLVKHYSAASFRVPSFAVNSSSRNFNNSNNYNNHSSTRTNTSSTRSSPTKTTTAAAAATIPTRGIKIKFNPRSQWNLAAAGGRELSRAQLGHLQANGEYYDDGMPLFSDGGGAAASILPTTGAVHNERQQQPLQQLQQQRFDSIQEGECEEADSASLVMSTTTMMMVNNGNDDNEHGAISVIQEGECEEAHCPEM